MANITMKDIARQSGYSIGTVSRAINHAPGVSREARKKILEIVQKTGYQINPNAKFLKQRQAQGVLILVKGRTNLIYDSLMTRLQELMENSDYEAVVQYIDESDDEVRTALDILTQRSLQGILFLGSDRMHFIDQFSGIGVPCVLVTNSAADLPYDNLSSVTTDDAAAAQFAIEYLFELGHEQIGVLGGYLDRSQCAKSRFQGVQYAFYSRSRHFDPNVQYAAGTFSLEGGYEAMKQLMGRMTDLSAVFCMSDIMAIGAMRAAKENGYVIGEDLAVIGFDGIDIGAYLNPSLTTIVQDLQKLAEESFSSLKAMIEHGSRSRHNQISFSMREGESACPEETVLLSE